MSDPQTLVRPYVRALVELAHTESDRLYWKTFLRQAADALKASVPQPTVEPSMARLYLVQMLKEWKGVDLTKPGLNFLELLAHYNRLQWLPDISQAFEHWLNQEQGILDVEVVTAFPLSDLLKEELVLALSKRFKRRIELHLTYEPDLLAGLLVRTSEGVVLDGTLRRRLNVFASSLQQ